MRTRYILLLALVVITGSLNAQQISRRTGFTVNTYLVNPAVAGTMKYTPFFATYRNQWAGFKGAPTTIMASAHTGFKNHIGIGGIVYSDNSGGAISETGLELTGAYNIDLNNFDAVSFGLSLTAGQYTFDNSSLVVYDQTDQALNGFAIEKEVNVDATFGFLVYGEQYYFGFSIPQLMESRLKLASEIAPSDNRNKRHFQFMGSYRHFLNDVWDIQPSGFLRIMGNVPPQLDVNVRMNYNGVGFAGLTYRHRDAIALMFGANYREFALCYSYDITTTDASTFSPHTHEITVGYYLPRKNGKFRTSSLGPRMLDRGRLVN